MLVKLMRHIFVSLIYGKVSDKIFCFSFMNHKSGDFELTYASIRDILILRKRKVFIGFSGMKVTTFCVFIAKKNE